MPNPAQGAPSRATANAPISLCPRARIEGVHSADIWFTSSCPFSLGEFRDMRFGALVSGLRLNLPDLLAWRSAFHAGYSSRIVEAVVGRRTASEGRHHA